MRTAITFWQMPADEAALFEFLRSTGHLQACLHQSLPLSETIKFRPLSTFRREDFGIILICQKRDIEAVQIDRYKAHGQYWHTVNPNVSRVLTYSRERLDQSELYQSTLGASLDYVHLPTGERRQKDAEFKQWAKLVVAWIKARCTETCALHGFHYPATPDVVAALAEGKIVLRH